MADRCNRRDILPHAVIVGGGDEHGTDGWILTQCPVDVIRTEQTGNAERLDGLGKDESRGQIEHGSCVRGRLVAVAVKQHVSTCTGSCIQHGMDALSRTAGQKMAVGRVVEACGLFLGLPDGTFSRVQVAGLVDLGEVQRQNGAEIGQNILALVPGHVKACGMFL